MAVTDHGNFDLALEATEELLSASLVAQAQVPAIPATPVSTPQFTVLPQLVASLTGVDCRAGAFATVALTGRVTGDLLVESINLPAPLPADPALRSIQVDSAFVVIANPVIGSVAGARGVVMPLATARVEVTINESAVLASFPIQALLTAAYLTGREAAYQQRRTEILTLMQAALASRLASAVSQAGNVLAIAEPGGMTFRTVLTTSATLKLLVTAIPPDGDGTLVNGLTVRRNSLGGPLDLACLAISNAHILGGLVLPLVTGALGIGGTPSRPEHPCLLLGGIPLPAATFGVPVLPNGAPAATVFLDVLLGQVDASGLRLDAVFRAVSVGGFATVRMRATATVPITATIVAGTLTVGLGAPTVTTTADITIDPAVFVIAALSGGFILVALVAVVGLFGAGFIDGFVRASILGSLAGIALPSVALPLAGAFAALSVMVTETTEPSAPARTFTIGQVTIPLDRANDVIIRMA
jgi:hypothetical protein